MKIFEVIAESIAATTLMTFFSMAMTESFRKLFTEPVLINYVLRLFKFGPNPKFSSAIGWILHYLIGFAFVVGYHLVWQTGVIESDWMSGLILGAISAIIGILGWLIIFSLPSDEPKVAFTGYYIQLFFAHVIFGLTAVGVHRLIAFIETA